MYKMNVAKADPIANDTRTILLYESVGLTAVIREEKLSIAKTIMEPHSAGTRHYHKDSIEIYFILSGSADLAVDEKIYNISTDDVILIQPAERHYMITRHEPVTFLAITLPAYSPDDFLVD